MMARLVFISVAASSLGLRVATTWLAMSHFLLLSFVVVPFRTFFPEANGGRIIRLKQGEFLLHPVSRPTSPVVLLREGSQ